MYTTQVLEDDEGQYIILPEECRFNGDAVRIEKHGSIIVLMPLEDWTHA